MAKARPDWKAFEVAVSEFIQALDPNATVRHNTQIPDLDTGRSRQRDVWVETKIGDFFPVKLLVSCKRLLRKVDQQDMDAFIGELRSSGAHKGVLYSYSGFAKPALEKANRLGICCCSLYKQQAPPLPDILIFDAYCNTERIHFSLSGNPGPHIQTLNQLFDIPVSDSIGTYTAISALVQIYRTTANKLIKNNLSDTPAPPTWQSSLQIENNALAGPVVIKIEPVWNLYQAKWEAFLIDGSYSFTSDYFRGSQSIPSIDTWGSHPGLGWELVDLHPESLLLPHIRIILWDGEIEQSIRNHFGSLSPLELLTISS